MYVGVFLYICIIYAYTYNVYYIVYIYITESLFYILGTNTIYTTLQLKMPQFSIEKRVHISLIQIFGVINPFNTPLHKTGSMKTEAFVGGCLHVHTPGTASGAL